jgi:hypothetical protein
MGDFDWLPLLLLLVLYVSTKAAFCTENLYLGFRKAKLKSTWDSASLSTETLRVMLMQFLDAAAVVCLQV